MKLAKIRHRVIATLLDNLIIFFCMSLLLIRVWPTIVYSIFHDVSLNWVMVIRLIRSGMVYALFLLFYYLVIPTFIKGQTLGKWVFKIKVVCENGSDADYKILFFREAICRILVRVASLGISSIVSFIVMLLRDDKKGLADIFAKTKVIDIKEEV